VLFPADNEKDVDDIPQNVRDDLLLIQVSHMDEVLPRALEDGAEAMSERVILVG
jgi:ATP-dependent Lon protease